MKKSIIILILTCFSLTFGAFDLPLTGAKTKALGNIMSVQDDIGSVITGNPAFLGSADKIFAGLTLFPKFSGFEAGTSIFHLNASYLMPIGKIGGIGAFGKGLFVSSGGINTYNEFEMGAAFGSKIGSFNYGLTVHLQKWNIGYVWDGVPFMTVNANLGVSYKIKELLTLGMTGYNLIGMSIAGYDVEGERVSPGINFGAKLDIKKFTAMVESGYEFVYTTLITRLGAEYRILDDKLSFRGGFEILSYYSYTPSFGIGYAPSDKLIFDYALAYPIYLGGAGEHLLSYSISF